MKQTKIVQEQNRRNFYKTRSKESRLNIFDFGVVLTGHDMVTAICRVATFKPRFQALSVPHTFEEMLL